MRAAQTEPRVRTQKPITRREFLGPQTGNSQHLSRAKQTPRDRREELTWACSGGREMVGDEKVRKVRGLIH
jgi:hypothetical protein